MHHCVFIIILLIVFVTLFKLLCDDSGSEGFSGAITQLVSRGPEDIYLTINTERYIPNSYYDGYYSPYGCNSPYCSRRRNRWYNNITPFVWNNATRFPSWYYSPYNYINNWYTDSYYYGMY